MRRTTLLTVACALAPAAAAFSPPARGSLLRDGARFTPIARSRPAVLAARTAAPRRAPAVVASAAVSAPMPSLAQLASRFIMACTAALFTVLLTAGRALAYTSTRTRSAGPLQSLGLSGDVLKYGFVGACMLAGIVFKKEETPILRETTRSDVGGEVVINEAPTALDALEDVSPGPTAAATAPPAALGDAEPDDSSLFSSLQGRMNQLAAERQAAEEAAARGETVDDAPPPSDSTDSWGTGSTAVLEPPRPPGDEDAPRGVLEGPSPLEFPPGFPLVDGEVVEVDQTPAASADDIAMLSRMFGSEAE